MRSRRVLAPLIAVAVAAGLAPPAAAAKPATSEDLQVVTREQALEAYAADPGAVFLVCEDFVVLAAFRNVRRITDFGDREVRHFRFRGELFRPDAEHSVVYGGHGRFAVSPDGVSFSGLGRWLVDREGRRHVFGAGHFTIDEDGFAEHGLNRESEVVCAALA